MVNSTQATVAAEEATQKREVMMSPDIKAIWT